MLAGDSPSRLVKMGDADAGRYGTYVQGIAEAFRACDHGNRPPRQDFAWPMSIRDVIHPTGFFTLAGGSVLVVTAVRTEAQEDQRIGRFVDVFLFLWGQGELVKDEYEYE
jgi:hypothetical protein